MAATITIDNLPDVALPLSGNEVVAGDQIGQTVQIPVSLLNAIFGANVRIITANTNIPGEAADRFVFIDQGTPAAAIYTLPPPAQTYGPIFLVDLKGSTQADPITVEDPSADIIGYLASSSIGGCAVFVSTGTAWVQLQF